MKSRTFLLSLLFLMICIPYFGQGFSRQLFVSQPRMNGDDVKALQTRLLELGFSGVGVADGYFGSLTEAAVKKMEFFLGFVQDGKVDKDLWQALFSKDEITIGLLSDIRIAQSMNISAFKKQEEDLEGISSEGAHLVKHSEGNIVKYIELDIYSEMGKVSYNIYCIDRRKIAVATLFQYPGQFDIDHAIKTNKVYYYADISAYVFINGKYAKENKDEARILEIIER